MTKTKLYHVPIYGRLGYSNWSHEWDKGFEPTNLTEFGMEAPHFGWDFAGCIWWEDGQFHEQVWVYGDPVEIVSAPSLKELVDTVNKKYGSD